MKLTRKSVPSLSRPRPPRGALEVGEQAAVQRGHAMRRSELRYRRLFETAHDGILIVDPATRRITDANPYILRLLGYSRKQLLQKELWQIGLLRDEAASRKAFRELKGNGFIRYENLPLKSKDGIHHEVEFVSNLYDEGGTAVIQCNIRDITERKLSRDALALSEARYRALFDLGPVGVYTCDARGVIVEYNQRAAKLWGRAPRVGDPSERFCGSFRLHLPDGTVVPHDKCPVAAVIQGLIPDARNVEVIVERSNGSRLTAIANIVPLRNARGEITGAINSFFDISERKQVEQALAEARTLLDRHADQLERTVAKRTRQLTTSNRRLAESVIATRNDREKYRKLFLESQVMHRKLRQLARQILSAQEEERKVISRELHDEVVQTLVGINVELSALSRGASLGVHTLKSKIVRTQRLVEHSVHAVHRFARGLRPVVLDDLGLIPALHAYSKALAARKKIKIHLTAFSGVETLDSEKRTVLYRVVQEALNNIVRHSQATQAGVRISQLTGAIRMEISDNGKSFDVEKIFMASNPKRLGLVGMRERIEMIGGTLTIVSAPGEGTTVRAQIPFLPEKTTL